MPEPHTEIAGLPESIDSNGLLGGFSSAQQLLDHHTINSFVALAKLGPESSILDIGYCGVAQVAMVAMDELKDNHEPIVVVDLSQNCSQEDRLVLESLVRQDEIMLLQGDPTRLDSIDGLYSQTNGPQSTFDVIFAWHVLDAIPAEQHIATLRHWTIFLTPGTGRIVLTLGMSAEGLGDTAGTIAINKHGEILQCSNMMLDSEWAVGEQALGALVVAAGLRLGETQRVGYGGEEVLQWNDQSDEYHEHAMLSHSQLPEEGDSDPLWTNADGTFSRYFKVKVKSEAVEWFEQQLLELREPGAEANMMIVPHMAVVAGVVSQG